MSFLSFEFLKKYLARFAGWLPSPSLLAVTTLNDHLSLRPVRPRGTQDESRRSCDG